MSVKAVIVQRTLHDELVTLVRNMIIEGELRPGSRIVESPLCARLGVSRTPLREALRVLSVEGLVRLLPNKGATVVRVTHEKVEEAVPVLGTLEALAGELACTRIDKDRLDRIKSIHRQMVEHFRRGERRSYVELNRVVHEAIFEAAHNKTLSETYNTLQARFSSLLLSSSEALRQMFQSAFQTSTGRAHWAIAVVEHEEMLAALEEGDGAQFAQVARGHVRHRAEVMHMAVDLAMRFETLPRFPPRWPSPAQMRPYACARREEAVKAARAARAAAKCEGNGNATAPSNETLLRMSERARALLREELGQGPKPGAQIAAAAEAADISEGSLNAAADELGVRTQRGQWWLPG